MQIAEHPKLPFVNEWRHSYFRQFYYRKHWNWGQRSGHISVTGKIAMMQSVTECHSEKQARKLPAAIGLKTAAVMKALSVYRMRGDDAGSAVLFLFIIHWIQTATWAASCRKRPSCVCVTSLNEAHHSTWESCTVRGGCLTAHTCMSYFKGLQSGGQTGRISWHARMNTHRHPCA